MGVRPKEYGVLNDISNSTFSKFFGLCSHIVYHLYETQGLQVFVGTIS